MDQSVFADVDVAAAGAAAPIDGLTQGDLLLESGEVSEISPAEALKLAVDGELFFTEGFELAVTVMNDADRAQTYWRRRRR